MSFVERPMADKARAETKMLFNRARRAEKTNKLPDCVARPYGVESWTWICMLGGH